MLLEIVVVAMALVTEGTLYRVVTKRLVQIIVQYILPSEEPTQNAHLKRVSDASS